MRLARLPAQVAELARVSREAARAYDTTALRAARRARRLRRRQHFEYGEALTEGLLDPRLPDDVTSLHGSRHGTVTLQRALNSEAMTSLTGEKAVFYRYCAAVGIRVPELYGIVDRAASGWSHRGRPVIGAEGFARFVADDLPDEWVVKPSAGYHGRGVRVVSRRGSELIDGDGRSLTPSALYAELTADREFGAWVVQERLHDHPDIARLSGSPTLQTARVVTLVDRAGSVDVLYAVLRVAVAGGAADNFRGGLSGNALVEVAVADGALGPVKIARAEGVGFDRTDSVPGTGIRVDGLRVPDWQAALALVRDAATAFLPARTLGWDVAITPQGPVVVEANMFWWPRSGPEQGPLTRRLREA